MKWLEFVTLLAIIQFLVFGYMTGRARRNYKVKAPAVSGNEMFERYYRVQMNTLELLVMLLPSLWLAARYMNLDWAAAAGAVYLIGRVVYYFAYIKNPASRALGFGLSLVPIIVLMATAAIGIIRSL